MNALRNEVLGYLEVLGYNFLEKAEDFLIADKVGFGGTHDTQQVWVPLRPEDDEDIPRLERRLLREFEEQANRYPKASRWIVADTFGGFSQRFRGEADSFGVQRRVPIQFFDTPFKSEGLTPATSLTLSELRKPIARIPQPFSVLTNGEPQKKGEDLLEHLRREFRFAEGASLRIIVGPAGVGKTWFFRSLFSGLYDYFLEQKRKLEAFPRPVPLVSDYFHRRGVALRTQDLVREFIDQELETYVSQATFEWMLEHGYALWLFDGLDELYAGDRRFFELLADLLTRPPESKAQILICARESLLASCPAFTDFIKDFPPGQSQEPAIELYRLERWEHPSKRAFAGLHLSDPPKESEFLTYISRSDSLRSLSSLPYYCNLLIDEFKQGNTAEFSDDFALIAHTVSAIIEREKGKTGIGVLLQSNLQSNGLDEWLETVASEYYATNSRGVNKTDAETYAMLVLNPELSEVERQSTITTLIQFPLLARGTEAGVLRFEHELIAEYLVGHHWLHRLINDPGRVAHELSTRVDFADSLIGRYMANQLPKQPGGIEALTQVLKNEALPGRDFTVLLQLLLMAMPARDLLGRYGINVEGRDLSQVRFIERDLTGYSFRNCDLSGTVFQSCNLQKALFEGACLIGTRFAQLSEESLEEAEFGNLERFEFVYVGQRRIDDRSKLAEWLQKVTGRAEPIQEPCPSALQLRALFLKFVYPDGSGRRNEMSVNVVTRGKRYPEAPDPEEFYQACLRVGYLQYIDWHARVKRVPGDRYDDMVDFVRDWKISERMREMLDSVCSINNCVHVPSSF